MKELGQLTINNYVVDDEDLSTSIHYALGTPVIEPAAGTIQLEDRTVNVFAPSQPVGSLSAVLPEGADGFARDLLLRVDLTDLAASVDSITFLLPDGSLAAVEAPDKSAVEAKDGVIVINGTLQLEQGASTIMRLLEVMQDTFYLTAKKTVVIQQRT